MKRQLVTVLVCICTLALPAAARAQHEDHGAMSPDQIGSASVKFETSCAPAVKDDFNKAVALLHSFWFPEATQDVSSDCRPRSGAARWRIGASRMSQWGNPFGGLRAARVDRARQGDHRQGARASDRRRRASARSSTPVAILLQQRRRGHAARARDRLRGGDESVSARIPTDTEVQDFLRPRGQPDGAADRQDLREEPEGGRHPRAALRSRCRRIRAWRTTSSTRTTRRRWPTRRSSRRASTRRSRPRFRTRCTCRRTRSRASAPGRNRSRPTGGRPKRRARATGPGRSCTRSTTRRTRICRSRRTRRPRRCSIALTSSSGARGARRPAPPVRERVRDCRHPGALCARARRLGRAAALTPRPANTPYTEAITHFARAIGAARSGNPAAATADIERLAALRDKPKRVQGRVLDRADRHSAPRRAGVADLRDGQQGRRPRAARARRRTPRTRPTSRRSRPDRWRRRASCSGYMLLDAGQRQGGARRLRGDDEEGAESVPRHLRRGARRRGRRRPREGDDATTRRCSRWRRTRTRSGRS